MSNNESGFSLSDVLTHFPPGAEIVGFTDGNGKDYNEEEIKAIESLEREQMKNTDMTPKPSFSQSLKNSVDELTKEGKVPRLEDIMAGNAPKSGKPARAIENLFMWHNDLVAFCNDKTCWTWEDNAWHKLVEAPKTKMIPQDD